MSSKLLNKQINILKNDVQDIITRLADNFDEMLLQDKNAKLKELRDLTEQYNIALNQEQEKKKNTEYKKVCRAVDGIEYARVKNKPNRSELMSNIKENREKAINDFNKFKKIEEEYSLLDIKEFPGFLFFQKNISDTYGLCPYIKIESENHKNTIKQNREEWLKSTSDNGKIYYDLYDKIILEKELNALIQEKFQLETFLNTFQDNILNDSQSKLLKDSIEYLKEYLECIIKTKKIKEKFKIIVNNLSTLVIETGLCINKYLSLKYELEIPINSNANETNGSITTNSQTRFLTEEYELKVDSYKMIKEKIVNSKKYITNVKQNLKQELYDHLLNLKPRLEKQIGNHIGKKWSQLTVENRNERYDSFSKFFVSKFLIIPELLDKSKQDQIIESLSKLLKESDIKFKHLKWNVTGGIIEKIHILKWDNEKELFYLDLPKEEVKELGSSTKKPASTKTIINKEMEKVINEEIVKFVISKLNTKTKTKSSSSTSPLTTTSETEKDIKTLKERFLEILKLKLHLKRITVNDKIQIFKKFDDIYGVILNN
jgi:hypothetical protein